MKKIIILSLSTLTLALAANNINAEIYKWTDATGAVHYSATPPLQTKKSKIKVKDIEDKIRFAAGKPQLNKNTSKKSADQLDENASNKNDSEELAPPNKKLITYCKNQRKNLAKLKQNFKTVWIEPTGKKTLLSQKQRKDKVKEIKQNIRKECAGV